MKRVAQYLTLAVALALPVLAKASVLSQTFDNTTLPSGSFSTEQTFTGYAGSITTTTFKVDLGQTNVDDSLCANSTIVDITSGYAAGTVVASCTSLNKAGAYWTFHWSSYTYLAGHTYTFWLQNANSSNLIYWRGSSTSNFANGQAYNSNGSSNTGCTFYAGLGNHCTNTDVADLYFDADVTNFVAFITPTNNATTTDFGQWGMTYGFATSSFTTGLLEVDYSQTSSTTPDYTDTGAVLKTTGGLTIGIPKSQALLTPPMPNGTGWYAWAKLYDETSTLVATSTPIHFTVSYNDSALGDSTITCNSSSSSLLEDGICWLFYPSPSILDGFTGLKDTLATKPPFGYVGAYLNAFSTSTLASGTATSSLSVASSIPFLATLKDGLSWLLWLLFGVYILKRFIHFDFHA